MQRMKYFTLDHGHAMLGAAGKLSSKCGATGWAGLGLSVQAVGINIQGHFGRAVKASAC